MAAEKKAATPTRYIVFRLIGENGPWDRVNGVTASSAQAAIRAGAALLSAEEQAGTFTAVPERSWKPLRVTPKTTVQLELTEVKP